MDILFQNILEISFLTSVAILILGLLSHFLGKRYGVRWRYFVWLIIGLRLILPFQFTLPQPIVEIPAPQVAVEPAGETKAISSEVDFERDAFLPVVKSSVEQNQLNQPSKIEEFFVILQGIWEQLWIFWLLGMAIYFAYQGKKYHGFLKSLKRNSRCIKDAEVLEIYYDVCIEMGMENRPEIYFCGSLPSPLCIGFFRQKIYLNHEDYRADQLRFIIKHELVHCKRRDIWYKALLVFAKGIHFFNPFVYWMVHLAELDIEYSCDSLVLEKCCLSQRQEYGLTILDSIRQGQSTNSISTAFHGDKEELKVRINHIFDMTKKKRGISSLLVLILVVSVGTAFVGCTADEQLQQTGEEAEDLIATLYECKLDYIGNHIGVGQIFGSFTLPKGLSPSEEGMELFTKEEPYGARRYLTLNQGVAIPENGWFEKDAMIFLSLVENATFFEYSITDENGEEKILHFDREDGAKYFGKTDLRSMVNDESTFRNFMEELDQLFPQADDADYFLKQIEGNLLLDEIAQEMGETFSYEELSENMKYDKLLKLGDAALTAILINFEKGQPDDTKGYIMMVACLEFMQTPVSVNDSLLQEMTPSQWYKAYCALDSMMLESFIYNEEKYVMDMEKAGLLTMKKATKEGLITRHSDVIKAVYTAMEQRFSEERSNRELQIYAPLISHVSKKEDKLSVYAVIGVNQYAFIRIPNKGHQLIENGGSSVPARLDFEKIDGSWVLVEWVDAMDGSEYTPSIKEMCEGTLGVANALISYDSREMQMLLLQNLIFYLNGKTDITVYHVSNMEEKDIREVTQYIPFVQT